MYYWHFVMREFTDDQWFSARMHQWRSESHINGSVQDCSNSTANSMGLLQSCTKPLNYYDVAWADVTPSAEHLSINTVWAIHSLHLPCTGCWSRRPGFGARKAVQSGHQAGICLGTAIPARSRNGSRYEEPKYMQNNSISAEKVYGRL